MAGPCPKQTQLCTTGGRNMPKSSPAHAHIMPSSSPNHAQIIIKTYFDVGAVFGDRCSLEKVVLGLVPLRGHGGLGAHARHTTIFRRWPARLCEADMRLKVCGAVPGRFGECSQGLGSAPEVLGSAPGVWGVLQGSLFVF